MFKKMSASVLKKRLPAVVAAGFEGADYGVPRVGLRQLAAVGSALVARAPAQRSSLEEDALEGVHEWVGNAALVLEHNEIVLPHAMGVKDLRVAVVKEATSIKTMVKAAAGSGMVEVREKAARAKTRLFRGDIDRINRLDPHSVWSVVKTLESKLSHHPGWREELHELVPSSMTKALFMAAAELGDVLGVTQDDGLEAPMDRKATADLLHRRITRYVAAMVASAKDDDVAACQRAEKALRPILALQAAVAKRKARKSAKAEAESPDEDEDLDDAALAEEDDDAEAPDVDAEDDDAATDDDDDEVAGGDDA